MCAGNDASGESLHYMLIFVDANVKRKEQVCLLTDAKSPL